MIKVAVIGAAGRMGKTVCEAVEDAPDMELVARIDAGDQINAQTLSGAQVAVEFSVPSASDANVRAAVAAGTNVVVGTTGWTAERLDALENDLRGSGRAVLVAPNFAISAVLAMRFSAMAAKYFESVEVIELHHPNKVDAPSGTATVTAQKIAEARAEAGLGPIPDATESDPAGTRGGKIAGVPVHAVRLRGLVAHQETLLGNEGEQLTIRTDSFDRVSFMPGVLLAVRKLANHAEGLARGLDAVMDDE